MFLLFVLKKTRLVHMHQSSPLSHLTANGGTAALPFQDAFGHSVQPGHTWIRCQVTGRDGVSSMLLKVFPHKT